MQDLCHEQYRAWGPSSWTLPQVKVRIWGAEGIWASSPVPGDLLEFREFFT